MIKSLRHIAGVAVMIAVLSGTASLSAASLLPAASAMRDSERFQGAYKEANTKCEGSVISFIYDDDGLYLGLEGLFDLDFGYKGEVKEVRNLANGIYIAGTMHAMEGLGGPRNVDADFTITEKPSGGYDLKVNFPELPGEPTTCVGGDYSMYKIEDGKIAGNMSAKVGEKITMSGLIKAVAPYIFRQEMLETRLYLKDHSVLKDGQMVRQDERNRYLDYGWGSEDRYMECKYWLTADGNVLLVINFHDGTYQYPQSLRFFKFNRSDGTMREISAPFSAKWPVGAEADQRGICYQVRYNSDGIVALVPEKYGDSFDVVTLRFDGEKFN